MNPFLVRLLCFYLLGALPSIQSAYAQDKTHHIQDTIAKYKSLSVEAYMAGNMDDYRDYSVKVLSIAEANQLGEIEVRALVNVAIYYQQTDQYKQALDYYIRAAGQVEESYETNDQLVYLVKTNLANLYNAMGQYDEAISTSKAIISFAQAHENSEQYLLAAYNVIGTAMLNKKDYTSGLEYMQKVRNLAASMKREDAMIIANNNIAECYLKLKNYEKAIEVAQKALDGITNDDLKEIQGWSNLIIGASYIGLGHAEKSVSPLEKAKEVSAEASFLKINMEAHQYLAQAYEMLSSYEKSLYEEKEYIRSREKYLQSLSNAERRQLEKESEDKSAIITGHKQSIESLHQQKQLYIVALSIFCTLLALSIYYYVQKKKQFKAESIQLEGAKKLLENENEKLKDKLQSLAYDVQKREETESLSSVKSASIPSDDQEHYMEKILNYMESEKPYLDPDIKQSDIAEALNMSIHLFSEIINSCFEKNFNNFINLYRVDTAKQLMKNPGYDHFKILAIGYEAGFPSKTSFNRIFKNMVGMTPTEYQKKHRMVEV